VIVGGGDPERMVLREFLDVCYVFAVETYQRGAQSGASIFDALKEMGDWGAGAVTASTPKERVEHKTATDNSAALVQFEAILKGLGG
jgi:hypothetical protein